MESKPQPDEIRVNREYSVLMKMMQEELEKLGGVYDYRAKQVVLRIISRFKQAYGDDDGI